MPGWQIVQKRTLPSFIEIQYVLFAFWFIYMILFIYKKGNVNSMSCLSDINVLLFTGNLNVTD